MKLGARTPGLRIGCLLIILASLHPAGAQDQDGAANQKKARETLDAMVTALGGQRWLTLTSAMQQGRTSGFYQGKPTGATAEFLRNSEISRPDPHRAGEEARRIGDH